MKTINEKMDTYKIDAVFDFAHQTINDDFSERIRAIIYGVSDDTVEDAVEDMRRALEDLRIAHKIIICALQKSV